MENKEIMAFDWKDRERKLDEISQAEFGYDYEGQDSGSQEWVENEYEIQKFESYRQRGRFLNEAEKLVEVTEKVINNE